MLIQRHHRKKENARRREKHLRRETMTASVLLQVPTDHAREGHRMIEMKKLRRRVASETIKAWLLSPHFIKRRKLRRASILLMQASLHAWRVGWRRGG